MTPEEQLAHNRASRRFRQWLASPDGQRCRAALRGPRYAAFWEFVGLVLLAIGTLIITICLMAW